MTAGTHIHGYYERPEELGSLAVYGSDAAAILALAKENPELAKQLHPDLPYIGAEVVWAARNEMSRTVDDALSRRTRALLLNARAAVEVAPAVAALLAKELGKDASWVEAQVNVFRELAAQYIAQGSKYPASPQVALHQARWLAHQSQVRARAEVGEVGKDLFDLAIGEPKPACEGPCILFDGGRRYQPSGAHIIGLVRADHGICAVHVSTLHRAARDNVVAPPAVVCAVAVCGQCPSKVGGGEGRYLVVHAQCRHRCIEVFESLAELRKEPRNLWPLIVMRIEAAESHIKDLAGDTESASSTDDPGNRLHRNGEMYCSSTCW